MAYDWEQYYRDKDQPYLVPDEVMVKELTGANPGRAIDFGSGEGANAIWLAAGGWEVTAVDQSKSALKTCLAEAKKRGLQINATCSDLLKYVPPEPFDLVLLAFIHFPQSERGNLFQKCRNLLKSTGQVMIISIINPTNKKATLPTDTFPTLTMLTRELQTAGLKIQKTQEIYRTMQWSETEGFEGETALITATKTIY